MIICDGRGDGGDHCCYIEGKVCEFLDTSNPLGPRCGKWDTMGDPEWQNAPVGLWFAKRYPGFTCIDWPQNITEVMEAGVGTCCWSVA